MSKRDDKQTAAEDYLAQLEWQSRQPPPYRGRGLRPWWASNEPKWKYQKIQSGWLTFPRIVRWMMWGVAALIGYAIYQIFLSGSGLAIYFGAVLLIAAVILFFAVRDASKPNDQDHEE